MATQFKKGDVVRLRSGGPDMTVDDVSTLTGKPRVRCVWFAGRKHEAAMFDPTNLVPSTAESP
jgi:uncharacterized protein YodC (DUF2158 family)